jgi:hypothetical protein
MLDPNGNWAEDEFDKIYVRAGCTYLDDGGAVSKYYRRFEFDINEGVSTGYFGRYTVFGRRYGTLAEVKAAINERIALKGERKP